MEQTGWYAHVENGKQYGFRRMSFDLVLRAQSQQIEWRLSAVLEPVSIKYYANYAVN